MSFTLQTREPRFCRLRSLRSALKVITLANEMSDFHYSVYFTHLTRIADHLKNITELFLRGPGFSVTLGRFEIVIELDRAAIQ